MLCCAKIKLSSNLLHRHPEDGAAEASPQNVKTCNTIFGSKHINYNTNAKRHARRPVVDPPVDSCHKHHILRRAASTPLRGMPSTTQQKPVRPCPISPGNGRHRRRRPKRRDTPTHPASSCKSGKRPKTSFLSCCSPYTGDSRNHFQNL